MTLRSFIFLFLLLAAGLRAGVPGSLRERGLILPEEVYPELRPLLEAAVAGSANFEILRQRAVEGEGERVMAGSLRGTRLDVYSRTIGAYEMRDDIEDRFRMGFYANLQAARPLYHWGRIRNQMEMADRRLDLADLNFERGGRDHLNEIRRQYLYRELNLERIRISRGTLELLRGLVESEERLREIGRATEASVLDARARLAEREEALAYFERERLVQEQSLARLTGMAELPPSGRTAARFAPLDLQGLTLLERTFALHESGAAPSVRAEELQREIEDLRLRVADRNHHPRFDLVAGIFSDQLEAFDSSDFALRIQYFAGVQVSWNLFDGGRTRGEKMAILARRRIHEIQAELARERLGEDTRRLFAELELMVKQMTSRSTRLDLARRRLDLVMRQLERNEATETARVEAELAMADVELQLTESRIHYLMGLAQLAALRFGDPLLR